MLGLAQLYQIRGRVGRGENAAHAYLMYPDGSELSEEARARLAALADYTELGSGYRVALRDLELRGAGSLLGDEQSGHVAAVGFELYCDLLAEAVAELSGNRGALMRPVRLDLALDAYVPADYVAYEAAKLDVHRRIALAETVDELRDIQIELTDRFGVPPPPVENLMLAQEARIKLAALGADSLTVRGARASLARITLGPGTCASCVSATVASSTTPWPASSDCHSRRSARWGRCLRSSTPSETSLSLGEGPRAAIATTPPERDAVDGGLRYCYR